MCQTLPESGLIEGNILFVDSTKLRANAGKANLHKKKWYEDQLKEIDQRIQQILNQCEQIDKSESQCGSLVVMPKSLPRQLDRAIGCRARKREEGKKVSDLPLSDVRVLDLTVARAGPTCVRQLADWGAEVVRVEGPEDLLGGGERRQTSDYQNLHRNKRSITLNLKAPEGLDVLYRLVDRADVLVENMRPQVKHRLGFDYERLHRRNPRLVYGSISGFGQDGPYAERGGVDQIAQGLGGLDECDRAPGHRPDPGGDPGGLISPPGCTWRSGSWSRWTTAGAPGRGGGSARRCSRRWWP